MKSMLHLEGEGWLAGVNEGRDGPWLVLSDSKHDL